MLSLKVASKLLGYTRLNDRGVKDMLSWLIARNTMQQNQWIAAIKELEAAEGGIVVPTTVPKDLEKREVAYTLFNFSQGNQSADGHKVRVWIVKVHLTM